MKKNDTNQTTSEKRRGSRTTAAVYIVLRVFVMAVMIRQIYTGNYFNAAMCVFTLILFLIPSIVDKRLNIKLPNALEVVVLLFIFSAEILGEIREYYVIFDHWDTMLHTINGFMMAAIGFALIDILNQTEKFHFTMTPIFVAMVAFCFSMTIGVLWEFAEFFIDSAFRTDMQKDTWISEISSVALHPENANVAVRVPIETVVITSKDGETIVFEGKYLDIGLIDTMKDLIVNCIGAVVFSVLGMFYIKGREKNQFGVFKAFIPTLKTPAEIERAKRDREKKRGKKKRTRKG